MDKETINNIKLELNDVQHLCESYRRKPNKKNT